MNDSPFQKPNVCRTQSVGSGDPSPYAIRRRPGKLAFPNQTRSPSAFKRKLKASSQLRFDDDMEDSDLKRCNSAPMLHDLNEIDARMPWHHGSVTPGSVRARRFSATVLSSPSGASSKSTSRLNQLKKEESLEGIQYKETAHEREVQTSLQMNHTCEELSLSDGTIGQISGSGDGPHLQSPLSDQSMPRSPLPSINPVSVPYVSKSCPSRAIDFASSNPPLAHHSPGGSIPSPLTISTGPPLNPPSLPPSPTRSLPYVSTGKQCYSPSMQVPLPAQYLRPGSLSPSPSPTRRTFVTRRRSQSPCVLKPSALGSIKRKYDSDSEGGSSPKRMFIPASQHSQMTVNPTIVESYPTYPPITPVFTRNSIYRSHSLSSSSMDSVTDINVSPSPPQPGVNMGFLSSTHPLSISSQMRDGNSGSPFQSPLHPFSNTVGAQELMRCSSPASSTCSSSSLEGLKDLPPFAQSHLVTQSTTFHPLVKPQIKELQSSDSSRNVSSTNLTS